MPNSTIRKFLCGISVGSLMILGISSRANSANPAKGGQAQSEKQTPQSTKSVAGKVAAIGSGGPYAQAAAQALIEHSQLSAKQIAEEAMKIAGKICIYTNDKITIEEL